ncbi:vomeronasal type-2 receptor 26-like [Tiliqua scincoides]|uniref:vomeronasal type-2 receptor 26-like n=1 Tax=Tiliqua scincoides TaxID=71010 RepID=UPI00346298E9
MMVFVVLIVALLPHAVCDAQNANCEIWHPRFAHHKTYQPGDLIIGGIVLQNLFLPNETTFIQNPPQPLLDSTFIQNYQQVLALEFAVKEINENHQLLPNITLGFHIYDSYAEARWTYQAVLQLISPKDRFVPNYKCSTQGNLMAVTEELTSDISYQVPEVLGHFKISQLLYGSAAVSMDKNQAISVYRMEPNGVHQYRGILQLLLHFKWTWIGFIAADEMDLQWFMDVMLQEFSKHGICFAILDSLSSLANDSNMKKSIIKLYDEIMTYKINVSVFYGDFDSMLWLRCLLITEGKGTNHKLRGKVWILAALMELKYSASYNNWNIQDFHGSLSLATHSHELQGFQGFLQSRNLSINKEDGFLKDFWENAFQCTFSSSPNNTKRASCTGEERLESLPEYIFPMSTTGQSYTLYNAVYAVAHALHAMYVSKSKNRAKMEEERREFQNQQPWQLHHFLKMVSLNNGVGNWIALDQNGKFNPGFDIINWVTFPNQTIVKVKVGRLDPQAPPDEAISINEDVIVWHSWFNEFVHHKYYQTGDLIIGGIVLQNLFLIDETTFKQIPPQPLLDSTFIQNYQQVLALEFAVKEIDENHQLLPNITLGFHIYDSYAEARWTYLATLHLISPKDRFVPNYKCDIQGNLMAVTEELTSDISHQVPEVLGHYKIPQLHHFLKILSFHNSAGDRISFDQSGELIAGFDILNCVTFPNQTLIKVKVGRLDSQAPPDKAITINDDGIVWHSWFNQARPLSLCNDNCHPGYSKRKKEGEPFCCYDCVPCLEGKVADQKDMADCFTCPNDHYPSKKQTSCIPKVVVFLSYEEPLDADMHSSPGEIILQCSLSPTIIYSELIFFGLLAIVSISVSFLAQKLPDAFKEAKFVTFSMFSYSCAWPAYALTYMSPRGKTKVAVEIFSILASSAAVLFFMFFPKCYIILWRPQLNSREQLRKLKR